MGATAITTNQSLTIRTAGPDDAAELVRLAQLDSARPLGEVATLVADVDGELVAALALGGDRAIANPLRHTAGIVALLEARAAELTARPAPRRRRLLGSLRLSPAGRA